MDLRDEWEAQLQPHFETAGLSAFQQECWVMARIDRLSPQQIRGMLHLKRTQDVRDFIGQADAKLSGLIGFHAASWQFSRDLVAAAAGKDDHEHRPDDLRGVTPDRASDKISGAKLAIHLPQDVGYGSVLWARTFMPNIFDQENSIPAV